MAQAILGDTFPPEKRGLAFALCGITAICSPSFREVPHDSRLLCAPQNGQVTVNTAVPSYHLNLSIGPPARHRSTNQ
jgi:hypothetical protein